MLIQSLSIYVIMRGDVLQCWSGNVEFVQRKVDCEAINYVVSKVEQTIAFCRTSERDTFFSKLQ